MVRTSMKRINRNADAEKTGKNTGRGMLSRLLACMLAVCMVLSSAVSSAYAAGGSEIFGFSDYTEGTLEETESAPETQAAADEDGSSEESQTAAETEASQTAAEETDGEWFAGDLSVTIGDAVITVTVPEEAHLPADVDLEAKEIKEKGVFGSSNSEYTELLEQASDVVREDNKVVTGGRFFDITFKAGADDMEPEAPVDVNISYNSAIDTGKASEVQVVHFDTSNTDSDRPEDADVKVIASDAVTEDGVIVANAEDAVKEVSFSADGFSVFGILYTVDFYYGEYEYHLNGEGEMMLSELLTALGILKTADIAGVAAEIAENTPAVPAEGRISSMAAIVNVTFSNDELLKIEKTNDDWKLTSLKPFDTEETLTIETAGMVITIKVTDANGLPTGDYKFAVRRANNALTQVGAGEFDTLEAAVAALIADNNASGYNIYVGDDYTLNTELVIGTNNRAVNIIGNGHTITRGANAAGTLITYSRSANFTIDNLTIDGGNVASTGPLLSITGNSATTFTNCTFNGSTANSSGGIISSTGNSGLNIGAVGKPVTINAKKTAGDVVYKSSSAALVLTECTIYGPEVDSSSYSLVRKVASSNAEFAIRNSYLYANKGGDIKNLVSFEAGSNRAYANFNENTYDGTDVIGDMITISCTAPANASNIINITQGSGDSVVVSTSTGNKSFINNNSSTTILSISGLNISSRGGLEEPVIYQQGTGALTISNSSFTGNSTASTPVIQAGSGAMTLTSVVVSGYASPTAGICAVDASAGAAANTVRIYGATEIKDNTAANKNANLKVTGTNHLYIYNTLTDM